MDPTRGTVFKDRKHTDNLPHAFMSHSSSVVMCCPPPAGSFYTPSKLGEQHAKLMDVCDATVSDLDGLLSRSMVIRANDFSMQEHILMYRVASEFVFQFLLREEPNLQPYVSQWDF